MPLALSPAACLLCRRTEADPDICGDKREKYGLCAHVFCLVSCTGPLSSIAVGCPCHSLLISSLPLPQNFAMSNFLQGKRRVGFMGFHPRDIRLAVGRAAQKVRA